MIKELMIRRQPTIRPLISRRLMKKKRRQQHQQEVKKHLLKGKRKQQEGKKHLLKGKGRGAGATNKQTGKPQPQIPEPVKNQQAPPKKQVTKKKNQLSNSQ